MEKTYEDITIVCKDCGKEFVFEAGQQRHFDSLGFTNQPVRCQDCRNKKKDQRNSNNNNTRNFNDYRFNDQRDAA